jgi:hypothetical protein
LHLKTYYNFFLIYVFSFAVELIHILFISNGDHSSNCFRKTSLLFHKWLAERFNLDDAWIVHFGYKDTSIINALIIWIGKFCKLVHKQTCSHDFFLFYKLWHYSTSYIGNSVFCFLISHDFPLHIVGVFFQSSAWNSVFSSQNTLYNGT